MTPLLIADASPIVGFVAAREHHILIEVSQLRWGGVILVPDHVHEEVERVTARISRNALDTYTWMLRSNHIERLGDAYGEVPTEDILTDALYDLLDLDTFAYDPNQKDLGEALAVAYATHFHRSGTDCLLLVDDGQGVGWATVRNLRRVGTMEVLELAIDDGVVTSRQQLAKTHAAIAVHSRLPGLPPAMLARLPK
jgi:predicted nucleic acid-binding protein